MQNFLALLQFDSLKKGAKNAEKLFSNFKHVIFFDYLSIWFAHVANVQFTKCPYHCFCYLLI